MQGCPDAEHLSISLHTPASRATAAAKILRQEPPRSAGGQDEDDAAEHRAIGYSRSAAFWLESVSRNEVLDGVPDNFREARLTHDESALWPSTGC